MDKIELDHRFAYHAPPDTQRKIDHEQVRDQCGDLAAELNRLLPEGREKSTAITKLEEVMFWANAALARQP